MPTHTFELDEARVTLPAPDGAEFHDLDGLAAGTRHLTWTAAPGAFFMVSAGAGPGYTAAGLVAGDGLVVESDAPAATAPGARRVAFRTVTQRPRRIVEGAGSVPERTVEELSDLLFVPGAHEQLRIGYVVEAGVPDAVRALLAGMLDRVEVTRRDA